MFVNLKPLDVCSDEPVHVNTGKHETTGCSLNTEPLRLNICKLEFTE